ncbi:MAG: hypothetical protein ABI569_05870, partial [Casimicrobiaceae bacterium]
MSAARLGAALLALLASIGPARAETVDCTPITALPMVITVQDVYCLTADISSAAASGNAIDVQTNNVVIDLNGFTLLGQGGVGTAAVGVHALDRVNVTIKNGTVRGFLKGIFLETSGLSQGHVVDGIRADQNTLVGIQADGTGNVVQYSQVARTGGTTTLGPNADAIGILSTGAGPRLIDNDVIDTAKQGTGSAVGIQFQNGTVGGLADTNRITGADKGIEFVAGASGKCRGNLIASVASPLIGCTDSGDPQPPVLTAGATLTYTEGDPAKVIDGTITVTDADSTNLVGASAQITGNCTSPEDVLSFTNQNGISGSYTAGNCLLTLSGSSSLANYQAALRSVGYSNPSVNPNPATRTVTWIGDDGQASSVPVTSTINVTAINNPPTAFGYVNLPAQAGIPITYPAGKLGGTDPDGTAVTINTTPDTLCAGCLLTLNADGSFVFTPPPLSAGTTVAFTYHVTDSGSPPPGVDSLPATVSFTVAGPSIFFVKQSAAGAGNCTLTNECLLATALANIGATTSTRIFIGDNGTYSNSVTLNSNGWLIGQGVTGTTFDALFGIGAPAQGTLTARPSLSLSAPTISIASLATNVVTLTNAGTTNSVRGVNLTTGSNSTKAIGGAGFGTLTTSDIVISGSGPALDLANGALSGSFTSISSSGGANGIKLTTIGGTSTLGNGALGGSTANTFEISGGTGTFTYNGTIASGGAHSVSVANKTGGSVTFNGAITDSATGISLTNNTGAAIGFAGGLNLTTGASAALTATGGGTVSATQNNTSIVNTLTTTTGTALNVANTTIGAAGLTFRSISSNGGTGNGITLDTTGASGGLTVVGDGTNVSVGGNGSGGTIANKSGADNNALQGTGIYLNNTSNVVLRRMTINGTNQNYGIHGYIVNNFTLEYSTVGGTNGTAATLPLPENSGEGSIYFGNVEGTGLSKNGLTGSATITNCNISGGRARNFSIINTSGTLNRLTITGSTFGLNQNFSNANQSLALEARVSGTVLNATITGSTFTGAPGDLANFTGQTATTMDVVFGGATGVPGTAPGNALTNSHAQNIVGGGGMTFATQGSMTFSFEGNAQSGADGSAITLQKAQLGTLLSGIVDNNRIGVTGVANSASKSGNGIFLSAAGAGTSALTITNNQVRNWKGNAAMFFDN